MSAAPSPQHKLFILELAEFFGQSLSDNQVLMYASVLASTPVPLLEQARAQLIADPKVTRMPLPAAILERLVANDGRPGPDEAWAMIPKDEASSVVWTEEMRDAWATARTLLDDDQIAARMAFKEAYAKLLAEARSQRRPARWEPSLGLNRATHEPTLRDAVRKGRLTAEHVSGLLGAPASAPRLQIAGPVDEPELGKVDPASAIAKIRARLESGGGL